MTGDSHAIDLFMAKVDQVCVADPRLTSLAGTILAGIAFEIAHDSRSLSRAVGIGHALVLREVQALVDLQRLQVTKREERTQRCSYVLLAVAGNDNL